MANPNQDVSSQTTSGTLKVSIVVGAPRTPSQVKATPTATLVMVAAAVLSRAALELEFNLMMITVLDLKASSILFFFNPDS